MLLGAIALLLCVLGGDTFAAPVEVLYGDRWKAIPAEVIRGKEYVPLDQVAAVTDGSVQRANGRFLLRLPKGVLVLTESIPRIQVGSREVALAAPPVLQGGQVWVPLEVLTIAMGERYGEERVFWDDVRRILWVGSTEHTLRLVRYRTYPEYTRIVWETTRPLEFVLREDETRVLTMEVKGGILPPALLRPLPVGDGLVRGVEASQAEGAARFVIQTEQSRGYTRAFALNNPDRIVLDLYRGKAVPSGPAAGPPPTSVGPSAPATRGSAPGAAPTSPAGPPPGGTRTIVIDPGHGGRDSGAVGPRGLKEKDVVLDIALRLRKLIQDRLGMRVILTRSEDVFVSLEERTAIANRAKADFFLSIHVNAAPKSRATGFETYFLSKEPSDNDARASAIRENLPLTEEGLGPKGQDSVKAILWDMAYALYTRESAELAGMMLEELDKILSVNNRGVKSGPFFVLMGAAMPSALVEVAFISNQQEERKLQEEAYKQRVAEALLEGITKFRARYEKRLGAAAPAPAG
ncbi:MAG: N-acetylmuramoyl-L-alanine amidase [candidate division NC10 bacterium]|nr:N-acetylmuramoyl-L-alanine amidase [candidate division NC10 bacterium]